MPKIKITFREFVNRWQLDDKSCSIMGLNPYCMVDGLANMEDTLMVSYKQARRLGITREEFLARFK